MAKSSTVGSVLTLIGGILTLILAAVLFFASIILMFVPSIRINSPEGEILLQAPFLFAIIAFAVFAFVLIVGLAKLYSAKLMKVPKSTLKGGVIALVAGIISSDLLSIIGGILGIVQGSK